MPRTYRMWIVIGLSLFVIGWLMAVLVQITIGVLTGNSISSSRAPEELVQRLIESQHVAIWLHLACGGVALIGMLVAFVTWIHWFVRVDTTPCEQTVSPNRR